MKTYTVEIAERSRSGGPPSRDDADGNAEAESPEGIAADVYNEDGTIEASARTSYDDYGLEADSDGGRPDPIRREVTADVTTLDVQFERGDGGFEFRVLGDREELLRERVSDEEWGLGARAERE